MDAECSSPDVGVGTPDQLVDLGIAGVVDADTHVGPVAVLVSRPAVVDRRAVLGGPLEEPVHRVVDAVHAQVGGDPVGDLVPLAVAVDRVREDVDEAGSDDQAGSVQHGPPPQRSGRDGDHRVPVNTYVGHGVKSGLGVDHPATGHHEVVAVVVNGGGRFPGHLAGWCRGGIRWSGTGGVENRRHGGR